MSWIKDIFEIIGKWFSSRPASDMKIIQDVYREAITDLKKELAEQKKIIESHRHKHRGNGHELDEWLKREELLHAKIIKLIQENRDLREELIFLKRQYKQ